MEVEEKEEEKEQRGGERKRRRERRRKGGRKGSLDKALLFMVEGKGVEKDTCRSFI